MTNSKNLVQLGKMDGETPGDLHICFHFASEQSVCCKVSLRTVNDWSILEWQTDRVPVHSGGKWKTPDPCSGYLEKTESLDHWVLRMYCHPFSSSNPKSWNICFTDMVIFHHFDQKLIPRIVLVKINVAKNSFISINRTFSRAHARSRLLVNLPLFSLSLPYLHTVIYLLAAKKSQFSDPYINVKPVLNWGFFFFLKVCKGSYKGFPCHKLLTISGFLSDFLPLYT